MDWSKAKTILIVSFILVNILLIYNLIVENKESVEIVDELFLEDVEDLLNNKNIILNTEIPKGIQSLPTLLVEYEKTNIRRINQVFFNNQAQITNKGEGLVLLETEDRKLTLVNNKLLIYEAMSNKEDANINNIEEANEFARNFLIKKGYDISDFKLSNSKIVEDDYYLEFSKVYKDRYLESAFTNFHLDSTGVKKMERLWLNVKEESKTPIYITEASKSILELLSINKAYDKTISDISLSYYFDPERHDYVENPKKARLGRTIPAWRIKFEDGYKIFLDDN